jgi:5-methylcytosine-specific restriction protein A
VTDPFYNSTAWKKTRTAAKKRDGYQCTQCGASGVPLDVDHIVSWRQRPDLALELSNLRTVCRRCHNRKRSRFSSNGDACRICNRRHKSCRFHSSTLCSCPHSRRW